MDVLMENQPPLTSPDGSSNGNPPERCPRNSAQEDRIISNQGINQSECNNDVKDKLKEEEGEVGVMEFSEGRYHHLKDIAGSAQENHISHEDLNQNDCNNAVKEEVKEETEVAVMEFSEGHADPLKDVAGSSQEDHISHEGINQSDCNNTLKEEIKKEEDEVGVMEFSEGHKDPLKDFPMETASDSNPPESCPPPLDSQGSTQEDPTIPLHHQGDGSSNRNPPESCPPPPLDSTQEDHTLPHHHEVDGPSNRNPPESCPPPPPPLDSTQEDHTVPHHDQGEEQINIQAKPTEEQVETYEGGDPPSEVEVTIEGEPDEAPRTSKTKIFKKQEFMTEFVQRWRNLPVLWQTKSSLHKNKEARKRALESLLLFVKTKIPTATIKDVKKKIGTIRGTYRTQRALVLKSMRSGAAADEIYRPNLWYYSQLHFLDDHLESRESLLTPPPRSSSSQLSSQEQPSSEEQPEFLEEPDCDTWSQIEQSQEEAEPTARQEEAGPSWRQEARWHAMLQIPPLHTPAKRARSMLQMEEETQALIREATAILREPPTAEQEFAALIASKLQNLEKDQRLRCETLIFKAINMAMLGKLDDDTDIVRIAPRVLASAPIPDPAVPAVSAPATTSTLGTQPPSTQLSRAAGKATSKSRK